MICFILAIFLALTGSAFGQCSSYAQQDNCTATMGFSLENHVGNGELLCGDLAAFESCILRISCLTIQNRNDLIGQARNVVANLGAYCPTSFPLPTTTSQTECISNADLDNCSRTFGLDAYAHLNNPTLICWDLTSFGNCIRNISCLTSDRYYELMDQARNVLRNMNVTCETNTMWTTTSDYSATNAPWLTTRRYEDCYTLTELDTCARVFGQSLYLHYRDQQSACSDLSVFTDCIFGISCLKRAEQYQLILEARSSVSDLKIFCDGMGPDDGIAFSGATLTPNKSFFSCLLAIAALIFISLK